MFTEKKKKKQLLFAKPKRKTIQICSNSKVTPFIFLFKHVDSLSPTASSWF